MNYRMQSSEPDLWRSSLEIIQFTLEVTFGACQFESDPVQSRSGFSVTCPVEF